MSRPGAGHGAGWSPDTARGARPAITTTSPFAGGVTYVRRYVLSLLGKGAWSVATRKNFSGAGTGVVAGVAGAAVPALAGGAFVGDEELRWHGAITTVLPPWWIVTAGGTTLEKSPPAGR